MTWAASGCRAWPDAGLGLVEACLGHVGVIRVRKGRRLCAGSSVALEKAYLVLFGAGSGQIR